MTAVFSLATQVRDLRAAAEARKLDVIEVELAHRDQFADLYRAKKDAEDALAAAEAALREAAVAEYVATGSKAPAPGVGIRVTKGLQYDAAQAFAWAKDTGMALVLDKKAFEKIAPAANLPFVVTIEVPSATIATDLDAALATAGVAS